MSSVLLPGEPLRLPSHFTKVVHEVELGVVIGMTGKNIQARHALDHVAGYFLAIDFTNRGLGMMFKKDGAPWCLQKGSDGFAAVSDIIDKSILSDPSNVKLNLKNNGVLKQTGTTSEMIMSIPDQIEYLSKYMTLNEGDMILSGTPNTPDFIAPGDILETSLSYNNV